MAVPDLSLSLSPQEKRVLRELGQGARWLEEGEIVNTSGLSPEAVRGALERLKTKGLANSSEKHERHLELTPRGKEAVEKGLPERRLLTTIAPGPLTQSEVRIRCGMDDKEFAAAIGQLRRASAIRISGVLEAIVSDPPSLLESEHLLQALAHGTHKGDVSDARMDELVRRGLVDRTAQMRRSWHISDQGSSIAPVLRDSATISALTMADMKSGAWRTSEFRPYDVRAPVPYVTGARRHDYLSWLKEAEQLLIGLGFEEARGPLVETEFYNNDALFIPQNHPARTAQDVFLIEGAEGKEPPTEVLQSVRNAHEGKPPAPEERALSEGWGGTFDPGLSRRLLLRSQTTSVSVRYLLQRPTPPFRMYCIGSVFRRESLDARHHIQFDQCEGVYGGENVNLRHLLGLFTTFARELGVGEVKFKPSYFPFTEPSVEGYVKHPAIGWMEVLPGGMFRPEVLRPLGIRVPVAAWGIGVMRLAMVALGIDDIREIYANPLDTLSEARA